MAEDVAVTVATPEHSAMATAMTKAKAIAITKCKDPGTCHGKQAMAKALAKNRAITMA